MKRMGTLFCSILLVSSLATGAESPATPQIILPPASSSTSPSVEMTNNSTQPVVERQIEMTTAISGLEFISAMTGKIIVAAVRNNVPALEPAVSENVPASQSPSEIPKADTSKTTAPTDTTIPEESIMRTIQVTVGNKTFLATLEENEAANAFAQQMKTEPIVLAMNDYSGFEKVGSLGVSLPASNSPMTAQSGDIVLYNGNQIVVFYGSNSWSYTKLGRINDLSDWEEALGNGNVTITFSNQ